MIFDVVHRYIEEQHLYCFLNVTSEVSEEGKSNLHFGDKELKNEYGPYN